MTASMGTSAASTAFCQARLDGPGGKYLWLDGNGKITAANGTLDAPRPNAFSLLHIKDCPGSTSSCRSSCYVHGLAKHSPDTYALYVHNSQEIRVIVDDPSLASDWAQCMVDWISTRAPGGFRWHVSGDIFSTPYARWIADVCRASPFVTHWIYTRSFQFSRPLTNIANLALNFSADGDNIDAAMRAAALAGKRICYMTTDGAVPELRDGDVIFPDYSLRSTTDAGTAWFAALPSVHKKMVCPVDYHSKSETRRCGPCRKCLV